MQPSVIGDPAVRADLDRRIAAFPPLDETTRATLRTLLRAGERELAAAVKLAATEPVGELTAGEI